MQPSSPATPSAGPGIFWGVALTALSTLMYQTLLTRIFSVTMWYHFAFMAISITLFGMTAGAILVYRFPGVFTPERVQRHLGLSALGFALTIVLSFLTHLITPFNPGISLLQLYSMAWTYGLLAIPFVCSGICMALAMTRFPNQVGKLYAADLVGAALGCPGVVLLLEVLDAPGAVLVSALLASLGGLAFLHKTPEATQLRSYGRALTLGLSLLCTLATFAALEKQPLLQLSWVKGRLEEPTLYERWSSFARITVRPWEARPFGWGLSDRIDPNLQVEQKLISIDAIADTVLTQFNGDLSTVQHLRYDVTNLAHTLRQQARVLVIGVGGGRDVLSALAAGQRSITGVEINGQILEALTGPFGSFTGQLDQQPGVKLVHDEARSYIARSTEQFDILQVSLIDTFAATAAGAYVLTENALYTVEAWERMIQRLSPTGILSFSRWYYKDRPAEMYRLTALASATLEKQGVKNPRAHLLIVRKLGFFGPGTPDGVGTLLLSPTPFSTQDQETLRAEVERLGFELVLTPTEALDPTFEQLTRGEGLAAFTQAYPLDISPPTDDRPFYFHMLRLHQLVRPELLDQGVVSFNLRAVLVLELLLLLVLGLTGLCIVAPLLLGMKRETLRGSTPLTLYFLSIGLGFMLLEIGIMQRLNLFLGHPLYGMTVVLFTLLLASGCGSALSGWLVEGSRARRMGGLGGLLGVALLTGAVEPVVFAHFEASNTPVRIGAAVGLLLPLGMGLGLAFPLGMRLASQRAEGLTPWLWGLNGAASVCASVLAVALSLSAGISATYAAGLSCYTVALCAYAWGSRGEASTPV